MTRLLLLAVLTTTLALGCTMPSANTPPAPTSLEPPATLTSAPPVPTTAAEIATATLAPPSTPFMAFTVTTSVDNALLRENPGYLFPQLAVLQQGSSLLVVGRSPGGEWLLCETADHRAGWVFGKLVTAGSRDVQEAPVIWPASSQVVVGMVRDQAGVPISGIQFSVIQGSGNNAPRNDAVTDTSGRFYAFMPGDATGTWTVSYTAVSCTSNTMDSNCNCVGGKCGTADPASATVQLPVSPETTLQFTWK